MRKTRVAGWSRLLAAAGMCFGLAAVPSTASAQSDSCATPVSIGLGATNVDTTGFTQDQPSPSCGFDATFTRDGWYSFTAGPAGGNYSFATSAATGTGLMTDTVISLYSTCGGAEIDCDDDDGPGLYSLIPSVTLGANETVLIRIAGFNNTAGRCVLTISQLTALTNDDCSTPITVNTGANGPFNNNGATTDGAASCQANSNADVWFSFTAGAAGVYRFDTEGSTTLTDTVVSILDACGGVELGCDDDGGTGLLSSAVATLTAGQNVRVRVAGFAAAQGQFNLNVAFVGAGGDPGDVCADAIAVNEAAFPLTGQTNTTSIVNGPAASCAFFGLDGPDIYYSITPASTGTAVVTVTPDVAFDPIISAAADCFSIDTTTLCGDAAGSGGAESVTLPVTAGVPFIVRVSGWNGSTGTFDLGLSIITGTPDNDDCANAEALIAGAPAVSGTNFGATGSSQFCAFGGAPDETDVFYSFTNTGVAASSFRFVVDPEPSLNAVLSAFTDCTLATRLACADVFIAGAPESLTTTVNPGQTVIVRVSGGDNTVGNFTILAEDLGPAPANADCAQAVVVTEGAANAVAGDNSAVGSSGPVATCSFGSADDNNALFYSFTADATGGSYQINAAATTEDLDATLSVYDLCANLGSFNLACADDTFPFLGPATETVSVNLAPNQTVIIRVGGWGLTTGPFEVSVIKEVPPTNDVCADAIDVSAGGAFLVDFPALATASDGVDPSCDGATAFEAAFGVWYEFTSPSVGGTLLAADFGPNFTNFTVYTGTCGSLTEVACSGTFELIQDVTAGTTYYILVSMDDDTLPAGAYDLEFLFVPVTGACCNGTSCTVVTEADCTTGGGTYQGDNTSCLPTPDFITVDAPVAIPDGVDNVSFGGVVQTITIGAGDAETITSLEVLVDVQHAWAGDLTLRLTGPNSAEALLLTRPGRALDCEIPGTPYGTANDVDGVYTIKDSAAVGFNDAVIAGPSPLASGEYFAQGCGGAAVSLNTIFGGISSAGTWTLSAEDYGSGITGVLFAFALNVNGSGTPVCDSGPAPCPGNFNGDGTVDLLDLLAFNSAWSGSLGQNVTPGSGADLNNDGIVDLLDLLAFNSAWSGNLGNNCP